MNVYVATTITVVALSHLNANAIATPPAEEPAYVETITVTATRSSSAANAVPVPVELITRDAIARRAATDVADLLAGREGVSVTRSGGIGQLTEVRLRGAEANHLQVQIDGIEINDPATGSSVDFAHLSAAGVERIELLRGAQSALWGADALAGVIYLDTTPARSSTRRRVRYTTGSFDTWSTEAELSTAGERWHYALAARHIQSAGTNVALSGGEEDAYRNTLWHLNTGYRSDDAELRLVARETRASTEIDPSPFPDFVPADGDVEQDLHHRAGGLSARFGRRSAWQHEIKGTLFESSNTSREENRKTGSADGRRVHVGYQSDFSFDDDARSTLTLATEYRREYFHQRAEVSAFGDPNQNQRTTSFATIAELRLAPIEPANLALSVRHDDNDAFADATNYRLAGRLDIGERGTVLFASYGTGVKNPTFTERFGYTPDTFIGNPNLEPERSESVAATLAHPLTKTFDIRLTWFRDRLENEIASFVFDPASSAFTAKNTTGTSHRSGTEQQLVWRPGAAVSIALDHTYLDATEPENEGQTAEVRRPRHSGAVRIDWEAGKDIGLQLGAVYVGTHTDFDFGTFPARRTSLSDYTVVHGAAVWRASACISLTARVENLTDARYQDVIGFRTPGRGLYFGLEGTL